MHDHTTSAVRRVAARATGPIARRQRRRLGCLRAADTFARQAGWTITATRFGGRIYRDPRFGQLAATRTSGPPHEPAPPAVGPPRRPPAPRALPARGTGPPPAPTGRMEPEGRR
jgi:hypothetical protein